MALRALMWQWLISAVRCVSAVQCTFRLCITRKVSSFATEDRISSLCLGLHAIFLSFFCLCIQGGRLCDYYLIAGRNNPREWGKWQATGIADAADQILDRSVQILRAQAMVWQNVKCSTVAWQKWRCRNNVIIGKKKWGSMRKQPQKGNFVAAHSHGGKQAPKCVASLP